MQILGLVTALSLVQPLHSWYPAECCSDQDCAPVDDVAQVEGGYQVGPDFVPAAKARPSQDGRYHICRLGRRVLCFFVPLNG